MQYRIGAEGPLDAQLAIVAEKPGKDELSHFINHSAGRPCGFANCPQAERPLVGASGGYVNRHLIKIGTARQHVYLTNAVKEFDALGNPKQQDIIDQQPDLFQELSAMPKLNCVVAMGQAAILSLTNFHLSEILSRRGSVLESPLGIKIVPTVHPSFYMHGEWRYQPIVEFDLKRALEQSQFPEIRRPQRTYAIGPTFDQAISLLDALIGSEWISFDIESYRSQTIRCIAFSNDPSCAVCIPFGYKDRKHYWSLDQEAIIWQKIQTVLAQPKTRYVTQNGLTYDCWHLWRHGIETPYMARGFDTLLAHRLIAPDLPHKLEFLTSIYTDEPFYKDESGKWGDVAVPDEQYWQYNCKDAAVTLECAWAMMNDLTEFKMLDYFERWVQPQWDAVMNMRKRGMRVDTSKLTMIHNTVLDGIAKGNAILQSDLGWVPNTKSKKDMKALFEQVGVRLTPSDYTKTGLPKTDKERLYTFAARSGERAQRVLGVCMDITANRTIESNFTNLALDKDDYYHPTLDISKTVTGRSASEGEDEGGPQIQNIPKRMRSIFIGDRDTSIIVSPDLRQAERMYVAWDAVDELLIRTFLAGKDAHRVTACKIFRGWTSDQLPSDTLLESIRVVCDECEAIGQTSCNHSERYMGKQSGLAFQYLMGPRRFVTTLAKQGVFIGEADATRIKGQVVSRAQLLWAERVGSQLRSTSWLENPLGRKRNFYGLPDVGKGLSWLAQSTIGDITHRAMIFLEKHLPHGARLYTETHDSLPVVCPVRLEADVRKLIETAFYCPIVLHGRELNIPVEITSGPSWGDQK